MTASSSPPTAVTEQARTLIEPELRAAVAGLDPHLGRAVGYHLGWCHPDGTPTPAPGTGGGKAIRPALTLLAATSVGATPHTALPGAAAVELVHNFTLIHDDMMDGDELRRRRPTVWKTFGAATAILAGDALHTLAFTALARHEGPHTPRATRTLSRAMTELVGGQTQDLAFVRRPWQGPAAVTIPEYRSMAAGKSGSLLGCAAELGAVLAGAPHRTTAAFGRAGRHFGLAFQCVDDIIGIWGDPEETGKPVLADIREGKKTLPVLAALAAPVPAAAELADLLTTPRPDETALRRAAELVEEAGGRRFAERESRHHLERGLACLAEADTQGTARGPLIDLIDYLGRRTS